MEKGGHWSKRAEREVKPNYRITQLLESDEDFKKMVTEIRQELGLEGIRDLKSFDEWKQKKGIDIQGWNVPLIGKKAKALREKFRLPFDWDKTIEWRIIFGSWVVIGLKGPYLQTCKEGGDNILKVVITPSTTREDLDALWPDIKRAIKEVYGDRVAKHWVTRNSLEIERLTIWAKWRNKEKLTYRQISDRWEKETKARGISEEIVRRSLRRKNLSTK